MSHFLVVRAVGQIRGPNPLYSLSRKSSGAQERNRTTDTRIRFRGGSGGSAVISTILQPFLSPVRPVRHRRGDPRDVSSYVHLAITALSRPIHTWLALSVALMRKTEGTAQSIGLRDKRSPTFEVQSILPVRCLVTSEMSGHSSNRKTKLRIVVRRSSE